MKTLKRSDISVGMRVVFVDCALNKHDVAHVATDRTSIPLDGREGVVVHINPSTDHATPCASKTKTVKVTVKRWEDDGDARKEVEHELEEHEACDCGFRPGQPVAVCLKEPHALAHSCDGFVPMTTKVGDVVMHHGVWATHGHLYTPEAYAAHKDAHAKAAAVHAVADAAKAKAHDVARAYVSGDAVVEDVKRG